MPLSCFKWDLKFYLLLDLDVLSTKKKKKSHFSSSFSNNAATATTTTKQQQNKKGGGLTPHHKKPKCWPIHIQSFFWLHIHVPLGLPSKSILAICKWWRHSQIPMINRKYWQNRHSNGPESRTSKINRRIRPSHMHGMDPLHALRPSTLINHMLVPWSSFTDDYPKP